MKVVPRARCRRPRQIGPNVSVGVRAGELVRDQRLFGRPSIHLTISVAGIEAGSSSIRQAAKLGTDTTRIP